MHNCSVVCEECGHKYAWHGRWSQMPACPSCGHRPDQSVLEQIDWQLELTRSMAHRRYNGVGKVSRS
jgi:predicted  nucleic acid-binding Zn-ribbon protein